MKNYNYTFDSANKYFPSLPVSLIFEQHSFLQCCKRFLQSSRCCTRISRFCLLLSQFSWFCSQFSQFSMSKAVVTAETQDQSKHRALLFENPSEIRIEQNFEMETHNLINQSILSKPSGELYVKLDE